MIEYSVIPLTLLLAAIEELIKAYLVVLFYNTKFRIGSYLLFPAFEFITKINEVYLHSRYELGASETMSVLAVVTVLTFSNSFHVMTSLVYANSKHIWLAISFCTLVHSMKNIYVSSLPTLPYNQYAFGSIIDAIALAMLLYLYLFLERKVSLVGKPPEH